jgi:predicted nucleic acid-binding protein
VNQRYWDSDAFLGWLNKEAGRFAQLDAIIQDAKAGKARIVTSTITYAEVFWIRGELTDAEKIAAIKELFGYSWVVPAQLDKVTAELARELLFTFGKTERLLPNDAIHLASAIRARVLGGIEHFDTWDRGLIHLAGQLHRVDKLKGKSTGADIRIGPPTGQVYLPGVIESLSEPIAPEPPSLRSGDGEIPTELPIAPARPSGPRVAPEPPPQGSSLGGPQPPRLTE